MRLSLPDDGLSQSIASLLQALCFYIDHCGVVQSFAQSAGHLR